MSSHCLLMLLLLSACKTWQPVMGSPTQLIAEENPSVVRLTRPDGTSVVVTAPRIENDSIAVAVSHTSPCSEALRLSCAELRSDLALETTYEQLSVDDIVTVETLHFSWGRTTATVMAIPLLLITIGIVTTGCVFMC